MRVARSIARTCTVALVGLAVAAPVASAEPATGSTPSSAPITYTLPGENLFPEGLGYDNATGYFYTGSLSDGSVSRGSIYAGTSETFLPAGGDGRTSTLGVRPAGDVLFVTGNGGTVWVYRISTKRLLAKLSTGAKRSLANDIAVGPGGVAYVSDSYVPILYRITRVGSTYRMSKFVNFTGTAFRYGSVEGVINADGISVTSNGRYVIVNALTAGALYRVDTVTKRVSRIVVRGGSLRNADGQALVGGSLYVARNADDVVVKLNFDRGFGSARIVKTYRSPAFDFPTGVGVAPGRLLVLNAQLDKFGSTTATPTTPFTVVSVPL